jgi:putative endopeptidase
VKPGDDFDAFVNGKWKAATKIPAKYPYYGVTTNLRIGSERAVRGIIDELAARQNPAGSIEQRVADMYRAYLDVDAINRAGLTPVKPYLERINAVKSHEELAALWAVPGFPAPLGEGVSIDRGDPTRNILYFGFGGIGLPDRDNYLVDNERNREMRSKYLDYLSFLLGKAGHAAPKETAATIYDLEKKIAGAMWDRAVSRNPALTTNRMSHAELVRLAGNFPLHRYFEGRGILPTDPFNVANIPPTDEEIKAQGLKPEQLAKLGGGVPAMMSLISAGCLESLDDRSTAERRLQPSSQRYRRCEFRFLRQVPAGARAPAGPLAARRFRSRRQPRRGHRQGVCPASLPRPEQGGDGRAGRQSAPGHVREPQGPPLDDSDYPRGRKDQARRAAGQDRLSQQV